MKNADLKRIKSNVKSYVLCNDLILHIIKTELGVLHVVCHEDEIEIFNTAELEKGKLREHIKLTYTAEKIDKQNILEHANEILNERSEEKERQYGPFSEGMERAAQIASGMTGRTWSGRDMYIALIALKFSRESYNAKYDNVLDAITYLAALVNYEKAKYENTRS